jgi:hypothetical protein
MTLAPVQVTKAEGVAGLYRGFSSVLIGALPGNMAYFGGYEVGKSVRTQPTSIAPRRCWRWTCEGRDARCCGMQSTLTRATRAEKSRVVTRGFTSTITFSLSACFTRGTGTTHSTSLATSFTAQPRLLDSSTPAP